MKDFKLTKKEREDVAEFCHTTIIHPVQWVGSGRYINQRDRSSSIISILERLGYKYKTGNDAPRGGANGFYIKISKVALKRLRGMI